MKQLLSHLRSVGTVSLYRKGASLFFQGEVPRSVTVILDGVVKAYTISPEGDETIVNLYGRGAVLPTAWVNNESATALFNYDAINDVRVVRINKSVFHDAIDKNSDMQREYLQYMMKSQAELLLRITGLSQSRAAEKICYTLYFLMFRYGVERAPGTYEIDLKLTQGMLANLIGQTRESTAKNIKALKQSGVVDYTSSTYTINKQKLEAFLGEDTFRDLAL